MRTHAAQALSAAAVVLALLPATAQAAEPGVGEIWTTEVSAASATFHGEIDPEGEATTYRFEYATDQAFQEKGFNGAAKAPAGGAASAGSGSAFVTVSQHVSALRSGTVYHYRLTATNGAGTAESAVRTFTTQPIGGAFALPDSRGWELVSPPEKNGGAIQGPEQVHGGGVIEAAATGVGEMTYSSTASFGGYGALGAPPASQYVSSRTIGGWSTANVTTPVVSGSYGSEPNGVPYQLFSPDLARGVMLNGERCRGEGSECPVANPPLAGSGAPGGYQDYYLRNDEDGSYTALVTAGNAELGLEPAEFSLAFAGASTDLRHLVLSTCAALTPAAAEVPAPGGCDQSKQNLYEWGEGQLTLLNAAPGAELAAQAGAVSADGGRVYFEEAGKLYRREGSQVVQVDEAQGGGGEFQTATPDGEIAFFVKSGHLYRFRLGEGLTNTSDLTPSGGVVGVLGASEDGGTVYYQDAGGLEERHEGGTTLVASGPEAAVATDYPPTTGTARVSADGSRLLFLSKESLTGYDNVDANTGQPDSEVFLWNGGEVLCLSCNPTGERPIGPSTIPGAYANGSLAAAAPGQIVTDSYKPRNLSATANRVFFDSGDALAPLDTNKASDAYQWEGQGTGSCTKTGGCLALISSGSDSEGAGFVDASESGEDAYFLTFSSLVPGDPGSRDVYDARVGGGFPVPTPPIPCEGDACAPLPSPPEDPTVGTLVPGPGNPPVHFPPVKKCRKGQRRVVRGGSVRCVAKHRHHRKRKKR